MTPRERFENYLLSCKKLWFVEANGHSTLECYKTIEGHLFILQRFNDGGLEVFHQSKFYHFNGIIEELKKGYDTVARTSETLD